MFRLKMKDGDRAVIAIKGIPVEISKHTERVLPEFAEKVVKEFQSKISHSDFSVPPLSTAYVKHKTSEGFPAQIFTRTGDYAQSIRAVADKLSVTVFASGNEKRSNIPYSDIASWLEYGQGSMPARPHWKPFGEYVVRNIWPTFAKKILQECLDSVKF